MLRNADWIAQEGSSISGTYWFKTQHDAEGIGKMLGLRGSHQVETPEGCFWSPGASEKELATRVRGVRARPDNTPPALPLQPFLRFEAFLRTQN